DTGSSDRRRRRRARSFRGPRRRGTGTRRVGRAVGLLRLAERHVDGLLLPVAQDRELHLVAGSEFDHHALQRVLRIDRLVVDLRDDVVHADPRLLPWRARDDLRDHDAGRARGQAQLRRLARGKRRVLDADESADDLAVLDELVRDRPNGVARDRKTQTLRFARDDVVHAYYLVRLDPDVRTV